METFKSPFIIKELTDDSLMPNGMYEGTKMANVPAQHLIWIYENRKCREDVANYVKKNLKVLKQQEKRDKELELRYKTYNSDYDE